MGGDRRDTGYDYFGLLILTVYYFNSFTWVQCVVYSLLRLVLVLRVSCRTSELELLGSLLVTIILCPFSHA